jgi:hypothetical protein
MLTQLKTMVILTKLSRAYSKLLKGLSRTNMPTNASNSKEFKIIFGGWNCREGVIAHNVTLGAYNNYKFLEFI